MVASRAGSAAALALLLALLSAYRGAAAQEAHNDAEAKVLLELRRAVNEWNPEWCAPWNGWQPGSELPHCRWDGVTCDDEERVTKILLHNTRSWFRRVCFWDMTPLQDTFRYGSRGGPGPLLPGLATLPRLADLDIRHQFASLGGSIPAEWGQPGAFPSLRRLWVTACSASGQLPDIQPGALPALESLHLALPSFSGTLPPSWGADPATLPRLRELRVEMRYAGPLPPGWAAGFPQLQSLSLRSVWDGGMAVPLAHTPGGLPGQWTNGFPQLRSLEISTVDLGGAVLPAAWAEQGFPVLRSLELPSCRLSGTLPPRLLESHPLLTVVDLRDNDLTGTLPPEWAHAKHIHAMDLSYNNLGGTAFPPAWLEPGTFPQLRRLEVANNTALGGTLPPSLPWPKLAVLDVSLTDVAGSVPATWCTAPFSETLLELVSTNVSHQLPPCAMNVHLVHMEDTTVLDPDLELLKRNAASALAGQQPQSTRVHPHLLLLAAVPAVIAAWVVHRRRRAQRGRQPGMADGLLDSRERQLSVSLAPGGGGHRRQVAALVSEELAGHNGGSIRMFSVDALPAAFLHQVGSSDAETADVASIGAHTVADTLAARGDRHATSAQPATAAAPAAADPEHSRQWGLETQALRLHPDSLTFICGPYGELVELGGGSHGVVYLARLGSTEVAVKAFQLQPGMASHAFWQEAALLRRAKHPRILPLLGVALKGQLLLLATGLMRGGSLRDALEDDDGRAALRWGHRGRQVAIDIAEALDFLHSQLGVRHNDLKASNVLLSEEWRACMADLGVAQFVGQDARTAAGFTATHAAPEQLLGYRCTLAADMYSLGVLLAELTTGQAVKRRGEWRLPRAPEECPQTVLELIQQCLAPAPEARPTAADALCVLREC